MAELEISESQVPPEALAAFSTLAPTPTAIAGEVEIDPVDTLDAAGLFELSKNKMFSPLEYAQQNPEKATNPDVVRKLADTHARIRERGFTFSDLPSVGEAAKGVGHMVAGAGRQLWNYANAFIGVPLAGVAGAVTGQPPTFSEELTQDAQRRMIETAAGTEAAVTGLSQLPGRAIGKIVHRVGTISGLGKPYDQQTEQEKSKAFFDDLGKAQAAGEIAQGRGGLVGAISGATQAELAAAGKPIRPEEVQTLAAGDPLSFILFGKAFGAAGRAAGRVIPTTGAGAAISKKVGEAITTVGGRTIQTAGKATEFGGAATKLAGKTLPVVGAIKGAAIGGPFVGPVGGLLGGLAAGGAAGRVVERLGRGVVGAGERLAGFGRQIATGAGITPYSQVARDILASSPIVASETLKGGAFDLALAAATSESPQETEAAAAFGTVLGGLKGVGRGALKVAQGQIITPRPWGSPKVTPAYGSFAALDALHSQASVSAAPGQALRANAIREFLSGAGDKVQAYLMPDAAGFEKAVTDILVRQGEAPAVAQATARSAAQAKGMFTGELIDDKGNSRRVVLLNEVDAAPHEAFHGIQDVLGESANQVVDGLVFQEYAPQWETIGQQYAQRLGGTGSWREIILDRSGWGNAAAAEKALRDAANKIEGETGAVARPQDVRALAEGVLTDARRNGAGWRDILTPEEATAEANRYLARELAAENFDAAFKALGSGLVEGNTLPEALARVIARTAKFMGVEPLAGARTEGLRIEPRLAVTETVTGLGRSLIEPEQARTVRLQKEQAAILQEQEAKNIQSEAVKTLAAAEAKQAKAKTVEEKRKASQELTQARTEKLRADTEAGAAKIKVTEAQQELVQARTEKLRADTEAGAAKIKVTEAQQELVQARTEKVRAATEREAEKWARKSATPETGATEADKVLTWLKTASIPVANRAAAAQTLAQAIQNQQGVRLTYFGAKGEPGGDPAALRPERRAEIEAQRDAANADRPIVTKDYFPYGAIITSKGPQFKGWSPNNFNANVTRFADWLAANPETASRIPLTHDLTTEAGKRGLQADLQTFVQNQQAGFTGSGLEVVVPEGTGATAPVRTGVQPVTLPQERADTISYLFNLKLPETPRMTAGKLPLNIVGQRVSEATLPGRVVEPVRPRGEFTGEKAEALGIAGEQIREVNPFRQTVEQVAKDAGVKPPELIEAAQILALDRIAYAEGAPELPAFGGNVVTLTAGFLPGEISRTGREILTMTPDEFQARSRDWNGGLTGEAKRVGLSATSIEEVNTLRQFEAEAKAKGAAAMKARDFDTAMSQASISQFFREAREAATGEGGIGEALRRDLGDAYVPPVSETTPATGAQFLPRARKPKNEFKILPAGAAGVSKAWVLPGGKVEQLGPQWHHDWLDKNKAVQEKYGLEVPAFEGGDAEGVREAALKKGFVRVNYSRNTGTLTVEARAQNWRRQKVAVEKLIEENLDDIDNVTVHLMDENVQRVVDSASERLFNYDSDVKKMANLPFITKGEVRGGSQFLPSENKVFTDELKKIRNGESGGQTFNADGSVWVPPAEPTDIVTLASVTIPRERLTGAEFEKATAPYQELLQQPNVAAGVFSFEQAGEPVTSIDINAVVPQTFRENTLAFARANDQVAIWDAAKNETVNTGGSGNTRITSPEQMRAAAESLAAGEAVDVAALTETTAGQFLPAEQAGLPGITSGREFDRKAIEGMSQAQLKEYFPEAIIPKKNTEFISDNIVGSPLAKAAGSRDAAVQAFADKLVRDYRSRENDPALKAGEKWYSEFTPLLKKEFGKDSRIFAELLAATSPNNAPSTNFAFALDALRNWKAGRYDKMISKFNEGLNKLADGGLAKIYQRDLKAGKVKNPPEKPSDATYLAHYIDKNNLIPLGSSGKRFSMHSVPVLKVLARKWMSLNTGPKTDNFIKNLVGEGDEATIDLWAARSLRRLGYEGFQKRWRILPRNKTGVSDEDFVFSQQVFRKAADELGIKPSALQGGMWYAEKKLWSERGWGKLDLGDYKTEVERMPQLRAGFESREARARAEAEAGETEQLEILPR